MLAGVIRWRLAAARREQARLESLVQQRTAELAAPADLPPRVVGDAQKLRQILDNLLADAGDIAALREAITAAKPAHPENLSLTQIETAVASYQLERVRQLLAPAS